MTRKHFTTDEVAEMFATDSASVRRWIREGRLKAVNTASGARIVYRIPETAIADFERANAAA